VQSRNVVDSVRNDERHDESPSASCDDIGDLDVEQTVMVANPTAGDGAGVDTIEADDIRCAEEAVGEQSQNTCYSVLGEDIQAVVDFEPIFNYEASAALYLTSSLLAHS